MRPDKTSYIERQLENCIIKSKRRLPDYRQVKWQNACWPGLWRK